jgi:uncharacterized protein with GYD domain
MAKYITLWKWTEQGVRNAKATVDRVKAFEDEAGRHGIKVLEFMWTQGQWDGFFICETNDEQALMAGLLNLVGAGNAVTQTSRAFDRAEMQQILQKM